MDYANFLGSIIGPFYLVMGLSILLYTKEWLKLVKEWEKNHFSMVIGMIFSLIFGLIIIQMYNVWDLSIWVLITLTGWISVLKALIYFLIPGNYIKTIIKTTNKTSWYYPSGVIMVILGAWMSYLVYIV